MWSSNLFYLIRSHIRLFPNSSLINFENIKVGEKHIKYIFIKNTSGIRSTVNLDTKYFKAVKAETTGDERSFADPMKRQPNLSETFKLKENTLGLGLGFERSSFELPEFSLVSFALIAIAELWGFYEDILKINIDGIIEPINIPIQINVIGNPIKLFTGKVVENDSEEISIMRFTKIFLDL